MFHLVLLVIELQVVLQQGLFKYATLSQLKKCYAKIFFYYEHKIVI